MVFCCRGRTSRPCVGVGSGVVSCVIVVVGVGAVESSAGPASSLVVWLLAVLVGVDGAGVCGISDGGGLPRWRSLASALVWMVVSGVWCVSIVPSGWSQLTVLVWVW